MLGWESEILVVLSCGVGGHWKYGNAAPVFCQNILNERKPGWNPEFTNQVCVGSLLVRFVA